MTTLVTEQEFRFGQENIIPYAGKVKISDKGEIEVDDNIAQQIVDCNCGFDFAVKKAGVKVTTTTTQEPTTTTTTVEQTTTTTTAEETTTTTTEEIKPQVEQVEVTKVEQDDLGGNDGGDSLENGATIETTLDRETAKVALEEKNLQELKEMAKPFPSAEWRSKNKADLIEYLLDKIN